MKQRLGHSIYSLFSGECKSSICKAISVNPRLTLFLAKCQINRPLVRGFKSIQRPLRSSFDEEDGFSELGPAVDDFTELGSPVVQSAGAPLKLVTEKLEHFKRNGRSSPSESSPIFKNILSGLSKGKGKASSASSPKVDKHNNVSGSGDNSKKASNLKNSSYVCIENVPSTVNVPQLIEAISKYGNTSSASIRTLPNGVICCDVKFENIESSRKAISAGEIAIGKFRLPISPLFVPETVTFRIKSICENTRDSNIHSMCKSFGALEGVSRDSKDVVHAFFSSKDELETQSILTKLNSTVIDECKWSAELLLPRNSRQMASMKDDYDDYKEELKLQMSNGIYELKMEASLKRVYAEDLDNLHFGIIHIEDQPATSN